MISEEKQRFKDIFLDLRDRADEALSLLEAEEVIGKLISVGCDIVHPESGEVLAVTNSEFRRPHPVAEHILAVARAYPQFYIVVEDAHYITLDDA